MFAIDVRENELVHIFQVTKKIKISEIIYILRVVLFFAVPFLSFSNRCVDPSVTRFKAMDHKFTFCQIILLVRRGRNYASIFEPLNFRYEK